MIRVGNAPCSWGVIENVAGERGAYARVLDEMHETGYRGTELGDWGFMPTDPRVLRDELSRRSLELTGSWVTVYLQDAARRAQSEADAVRTARLLAEVGGQEGVIVLGNDPYGDAVRMQNAGRIQSEHGMSAEQWRAFVEGAQRVASAVKRESGLRTVLHHHIGTWVETPTEVETFLERTDPELIGIVFDTGHYSFGGGNALEGLQKHAQRVWYVHFKDHDPHAAARARAHECDAVQAVEQGVFCELGKGDVDFEAVLASLEGMGYQGWVVVEQDVLPGMGSPKESAARNRAYLQSLGL